MHFVVGLQVNEHLKGGSSAQTCQTARKRRPHDFSLILTSFFESAPKQI